MTSVGRKKERSKRVEAEWGEAGERKESKKGNVREGKGKTGNRAE